MKLTYLLRLCVFFGLISSFWALFVLTVTTFMLFREVRLVYVSCDYLHSDVMTNDLVITESCEGSFEVY